MSELREKIAKIVYDIASGLTNAPLTWDTAAAAEKNYCREHADRILALLDEPEPVGYAPWHPDADGTVRGGMLTKDGRLEVYVEEHHCPRDLPYVALYASPTPTSADEGGEEV